MINPLREVEINHFILRHPRVDDDLSGFTLAQITDIHMGRWVKPGHVRALSEFVNQQNPQLVVLTGDYIGYDKHDLFPCAEALGVLEAPRFAVLGNHDHWGSTELAHQAFAQAKIPLLNNDALVFEDRRARLQLVGVDDHVTQHSDLEAAFRDVDPDLFCLTLNHVPSISEQCIQRGADFVLSGHTHGFQFNIPRMTHKIAETFGTRFFAGPYRIQDSFLYISRGLGSASWPLRIRALPELTFFRLEHSDQLQLELVSHDSQRIDPVD